MLWRARLELRFVPLRVLHFARRADVGLLFVVNKIGWLLLLPLLPSRTHDARARFVLRMRGQSGLALHLLLHEDGDEVLLPAFELNHLIPVRLGRVEHGVC